MKKRYLFVLAAAMLCASCLLTACGGDADEKELSAEEQGKEQIEADRAKGFGFDEDESDKKLILKNAPKDITSYEIPYGVTSIGDEAFYWCKNLTSLTIPNSVTSIVNSAFAGCKSLKSVTIGSGVISIVNSAFAGCAALTRVTIPQNCRYEDQEPRNSFPENCTVSK